VALREDRTNRPIITKPQLLVFKEKHGERYFHVPDDAALFKAALKVLSERFEEGCWYYKPEDKPEPPDVTEAQIETLPKSLQAAAMQKRREYNNKLRDYQFELEIFELIEKAIEKKDGRAAWRILKDRAEGEYEGCDLERYESVEDDED